MSEDRRHLDLHFQAVFWAYTARNLTARAKEFEYRILETAHAGADAVTVAESWQCTADRHFALLALAHVAKVCDLVDDLPAFPDADVLMLLRNYAEHWEDPRGRAGRALDRLRYDKASEGELFVDEWHYLDGDRRDELQAWLVEVDRIARVLAEGQDDKLPDPSEAV